MSRRLAALAVLGAVVACVTVTLIEGRPQHLPGVALGSPVLLHAERALAMLAVLVAAAEMPETNQRPAAEVRDEEGHGRRTLESGRRVATPSAAATGGAFSTSPEAAAGASQSCAGHSSGHPESLRALGSKSERSSADVATWRLRRTALGGDKKESRDQPASGARARTITASCRPILLVRSVVALMVWLADLA